MPISAPPPSWDSIKNKPTTVSGFGISDMASQSVASAVSASNGVNPGVVAYFPATTAPSGFIKANGAAISRTTYAALFAAIGTTFGTGNGSTTFNVPDLRGEFMRSLDDGRGVDSGRGIGTFQADDLKSHTHTVPGNTSNSSGSPNRILSNTNSATNVTNDTNATGGAETRPRNIALLACIKY